MSTAANGRAAVERYLAAAQAGDAEGVREVFAEDASWQLRGDLPISGSWNGRDAIVDEFLATALSDGRIHAVREYMDTLYAHRVAFSGAS